MLGEVRSVFRGLFYGEIDSPWGGVDFRALSDEGIPGELRSFAAYLSGESDSRPRGFLGIGAELVERELRGLLEENPSLRDEIKPLARAVDRGERPWDGDARTRLWRLFFPEGAALEGDREGAVEELRRRRRVTVTEKNPEPLTDPGNEVIFTSNVLITVPENGAILDGLDLPEEMRKGIAAVMEEPQLYFYDHPIHIGVDPDANEAVYGLRGLNDAIGFEKRRGTMDPDSRATVLLSLSVTHEGLHTVAREYLSMELRRAGSLDNLEVYLFTEVDARCILDELLAPYLPSDHGVAEVFGVDGEYGRHYSFLKAMPAVWQVFVDPAVRGTFKIDLDQLFPQEALVKETSASALEHFMTPLWGARGEDADGRAVNLGLIAGALVNEKDIHRGLFTPDVPVPEEIPSGEAAVFFNKLPMALSTRAEMMSRYDGRGPQTLDGEHRCLQRVHVTGGTNGILLASLREHRPFTPSFIGRAEDQAYLLSVLFEGDPLLRYLHKPGLIMRHDKEAFAGAAIAAAEEGRFIGDLARTLIFSEYAELLPWGFGRTKEAIDPFTGCFATRRKFSVVFLRLALRAAGAAAKGGDPSALLDLAERKLTPLLPAGEFDLAAAYSKERSAWNAFYDALDRAETESGGAGSHLLGSAEAIVEATRLV